MTATALTDRERWIVVGGGLLTAAAAIIIGLPSSSVADVVFPYPPHAMLLIWLLPVLAVLFGPVAWPVAPIVAAAVLLAALMRESAWMRGNRDVVAYPIKAEREGAP